eukprot:653835_1
MTYNETYLFSRDMTEMGYELTQFVDQKHIIFKNDPNRGKRLNRPIITDGKRLGRMAGDLFSLHQLDERQYDVTVQKVFRKWRKKHLFMKRRLVFKHKGNVVHATKMPSY